MRWSWADYLETPMPVIEEVEQWMIDEHERLVEIRRQQAAELERMRTRRR